jgi:Domain of unknown function (DUF4281)
MAQGMESFLDILIFVPYLKNTTIKISRGHRADMIDPGIVFQIVNTLVLFPWIALIIVPNHPLTHKLIRSGIISAILSFVYLICFVAAQFLPKDPAAASDGSLQIRMGSSHGMGALFGVRLICGLR